MKILAILFLFFGLYLSVCIWIFLIVSNAYKKLILHGYFNVQKKYINDVNFQLDELRNGRISSDIEIKVLCKRFKLKRNEMYFLHQFIYSVNSISDKKLIKEYIGKIFPKIRANLFFKPNENYSDKAYRLMLLGEFRLDTKEINEFILKSFSDESFEVRTNALRSLSIIGNSYYFNLGLRQACCSELYFNPRHITDMMGSFEGDVEALKNEMLTSFYKNNERYQYNVIVYLSDIISNDSMNFVLDYIDNNKNINKNNGINSKEVVIACIRYFQVCENNIGAKKVIERFMDNEDLEIRAVLVKIFPKYFYDDPKVIYMLTGDQYLRNQDWHVRKNSADSLIKMGLSKDEILKELDEEDKYAKDALIYAMFKENLIDYNDFLELGGEVGV